MSSSLGLVEVDGTVDSIHRQHPDRVTTIEADVCDLPAQQQGNRWKQMHSVQVLDLANVVLLPSNLVFMKEQPIDGNDDEIEDEGHSE